MTLLKLYENLLNYAGRTVSENGFINTKIKEKLHPVIINEKMLVLPTDQHLKNISGDNIVIFHPLCENALRGESVVLQKFRSIINQRINWIIGIVSMSLLQLAASPKKHKDLNPDQHGLLIAITNADNTSITNLSSIILNGLGNQGDRFFVNIYLHKGGTVKGKRHDCTGIVTFPFYQELLKNTDTIEGVKIRVKDREVYKKLFEYLIPGIEEKESYCLGVDSDIAPRFETLIKTSLKIMSVLKEHILRFSDFIEDYEDLVYDDEWVDILDNLHSLLPEIRRIPMQGGNDGSKSSVLTTEPVVQNSIPQPMVNNTTQGPVVKHTAKGIDFAATAASLSMGNNNHFAPLPIQQQQPNPFIPVQKQIYQPQQVVRQPSWAIPQTNTGYNQQMQPMFQQNIVPEIDVNRI